MAWPGCQLLCGPGRRRSRRRHVDGHVARILVPGAVRRARSRRGRSDRGSQLSMQGPLPWSRELTHISTGRLLPRLWSVLVDLTHRRTRHWPQWLRGLLKVTCSGPRCWHKGWLVKLRRWLRGGKLGLLGRRRRGVLLRLRLAGGSGPWRHAWAVRRRLGLGARGLGLARQHGQLRLVLCGLWRILLGERWRWQILLWLAGGRLAGVQWLSGRHPLRLLLGRRGTL